MPIVDVIVESVVSQSIRARQVCGMFDVPPQEKQRIAWNGFVPIEERDWNVGLIVGPSGCGKTTVARSMFGVDFDRKTEWHNLSVLDDFSQEIDIADIAGMCQSVGFNTIPAWLRSFEVLSNGEKFRVEIARRLLEHGDPIVVDEFTSVVDRQVAQIGSYAIQKHVRKHSRKFVAVSCHYDIVEWLNPDWILEPATMTFQWRSLRRRPEIECVIARVPYALWRTFAPYHYLTSELANSAQCFALFVGERPAVFCGLMHRPISRGDIVKSIWGVSRVVTLPDYQGLGLAFVLLDTLGAAIAACRARLRMYPAHPGFIRSFDRSDKWELRKRPGKYSGKVTGTAGGGGQRPCAVFEYCGPKAKNLVEARKLLAIKSLGGSLRFLDLDTTSTQNEALVAL